MKAFFFLLLSPLFLTGCLVDELQKLPTTLRGTKTEGESSMNVSAVNFGLRKGDGYFRLQMQIFEELNAKPVIITVQVKENVDDKLAVSSNASSRVVELKVNGNCAKNQNENLKLCWSNTSIELEGLPSPNTKYTLRRFDNQTDEPIPPRVWSVEELVSRARLYNFSSLRDVERVYRAKESIRMARGNLLPNFNVRDAIGFAIEGPFSLIDSVGNVLPFIFPASWLNFSKSKELYQAELFSFAGAIGNEMNAVETLSYSIMRDQVLRRRLSDVAIRFTDLFRKAKYFEEQGIYPAWVAREISIEKKKIESDLRSLDSLLEKERTWLSHSVGLPPAQQSILEVLIAEPDEESLNFDDVEDLHRKVRSRSVELRALFFIEKAAEISTKESVFGFLDPASDVTLGFSTPHRIRISKSEVRDIQIRQKEMKSLLEQRLLDIKSAATEATDLRQLADEGLADVNARIRQLVDLPLEQGELVWTEDTLDRTLRMYEKQLGFLVQKDSASFALSIARAQFERLLVQGRYEGLSLGNHFPNERWP